MRARKLVRRVVNRLGFDIVRRQAPTVGRSFFAVAPTCQIPNLGFIYEQVFGQTRSGLFVEVGAFDGYSYSNTSCLAEVGWRGVYVEPVPAFADACRARYQGNDRIRVITAAVGREPGEATINVAGAYSTANEATLAEDSRLGRREGVSAVVTARVVTLDELLASAGIPPGFDLLVVDVEGSEGDVFAGFDLEAWRPVMLIVELTDMHPIVAAHREDHARLGLEIADAGYDVVFKNTSNTIFVHRTRTRPSAGAASGPRSQNRRRRQRRSRTSPPPGSEPPTDG